MPIICPTVLAADAQDFKRQMDKVAHLGHRVQIDLTDGVFAKTETINPKEIWWPVGFKADIHLMYQEPIAAAREVLKQQPHLIIVHAEAGGDFEQFVKLCHDHEVEAGVALLAATSPEVIVESLPKIDHVLIFSGDLGRFGGRADMALLEKVEFLKRSKPEIEVGWDGGINLQNVSELVFGGVDVLNVGGSIQNAPEPEKAYVSLVRIAEETGTT